MALKPSIIQVFTGGLQTRVAPHIAGTSAALVCNNVNLESGILEPMKSPTKFMDATDSTIVWYKDTFSYHPAGSVFCNMLDAGFIATPNGIKKTSDGTTWHNLGIEAPLNKPTVEAGIVDADTYKTITLAKTQWTEYPSSGEWALRWTNAENKDLRVMVVIPLLSQTNTDPTITARNGTKDTSRKWTSSMRVQLTISSPNTTDKVEYLANEDKVVRTKVEAPSNLGGILVDKISDDKMMRVSYGQTPDSTTITENMVTSGETYVNVPRGATLMIRLLASDVENKAGEPYNTTAPEPTTIAKDNMARINDDIKLVLFEMDAKRDSGQLASADYRWCYTYYNANDGTESAPSPYTDATTIGELIEKSDSTYWLNSYAVLSNIEASPDPQVTHIRIYRLGGGISNFRLIDTIENRNASITDNVSSYDLGDACTTIGYAVPPIVSYLATAYGMLFGCKDNILYYSDANIPTNWDPLNYIIFDDNITGIGPTSAGLLVFTKYRTYIISGNSPENFYKQLLYDNIGCISSGSIVTSGSECMWQGLNGVYIFSNGLTNLTFNKVGSTLDTITSSCVSDGSYYGVMADKILVISMQLDYAVHYISLADVTSIISARNKPAFVIGKAAYTFDGSPMELEWQSTWLQTGLTLLKNYKSVYVYAEGDMSYEIFIGNTSVATGKLLDGTTTDIKVSQSGRNGYYMSFKFKGTGKVYEIQYISEDRQNVQ